MVSPKEAKERLEGKPVEPLKDLVPHGQDPDLIHPRGECTICDQLVHVRKEGQ